MNLKLHNRDEVFLVKLDSALYFKAEDHYTCVYYGRDTCAHRGRIGVV